MKNAILFQLLLLIGHLITAQNQNAPDFKLPNQLEIKNNLYCDKTEVTNIDWREYMYWNRRIFGPTSKEYITSLPDTGCWAIVDPSLTDVGGTYFLSSEYDFYPVVGISQEQARAYSAWRSDRVFEQYLITKFEYTLDTTQSRTNHFTTSAYLSNTLPHYPFKSEVKYYPIFNLPGDEERTSILEFLELANESFNTSKYHYDGLEEKKISKNGFVTRSSRGNKKSHTLYDIKGNVAEWSNESHITYGCSWICNAQQLTQLDRVEEIKQNAWTGFRNIARWEKVSN